MGKGEDDNKSNKNIDLLLVCLLRKSKATFEKLVRPV